MNHRKAGKSTAILQPICSANDSDANPPVPVPEIPHMGDICGPEYDGRSGEQDWEGLVA